MTQDTVVPPAGHEDEVGARCFVDVFSCRPFDADIASAVAVAHFGGTPIVTVLLR
jgi:hypothetical protein